MNYRAERGRSNYQGSLGVTTLTIMISMDVLYDKIHITHFKLVTVYFAPIISP